jgi:hypothetical protein
MFHVDVPVAPKAIFVFKDHLFLTAFVSEFFRLESRKHLIKTFGKLLNKLAKASTEAWDIDSERMVRRATKGLESKKEIKQKTAEAQEKAAQNQKTLTEWAGQFATAIVGALTSSSMPPMLVEFASRLYSEIKSAMSDLPDEMALAVGPIAILIVRFYVQAIQAPSFYDITGSKLSNTP